jgi:hypothetical protein
MTILELCRMADAPLTIWYRSSWVSARIQGAEIKEGAFLTTCSGRGKTIEEAVARYCERISDKLLVINASGEKRREVQLSEVTP